ncbi:hypothetical protein [Nitrobacter sp.]
MRRNGNAVIMISDNRELFPPEEAPHHLPMHRWQEEVIEDAGRSDQPDST